MPDDEGPSDEDNNASFTQPRSHFVDEDEDEEDLNYDDTQEVEEEFVSSVTLFP